MSTISESRSGEPAHAQSLPGRQQFLHYLTAACRDSGQLGVLVVRLSKCRSLNIEYGYWVVDTLAARLEESLRDIKRPQDYLARLAKNEFALLLPAIKGEGHALLAVNRILDTFAKPVALGQRHIRAPVCVGVALAPQSRGADAERLLRQADQAVAEAKKRSSRFAFYQPTGMDQVPLSLAADLERAIEYSHLDMHFQPKLDLRTGAVTGVEALARWQQEDGRQVPPEVFIPVAERTGLIMPLTLLTLDIALRRLRDFRRIGLPLDIAVNLSATLLPEPEFIELVAQALAVWDVEACHLTLEVTETAVMSDPEGSLQTLRRLQTLGVRSSLDDFGTGFSSLAYLRQMPVSELKIDRSFIRCLARAEEDQRIVRTIIDLAHGLGLAVVAEGVEDDTTRALLTRLGCEYAQGYGISHPLPADVLVRWLNGRASHGQAAAAQ